MKKIVVSVFAVLMMLSAASAFAIGAGDIQSWTGSGDSWAIMVVDWNDGASADCLAWGYRWDSADTKTGKDMLLAIAAQDRYLDYVLGFGGGYIDYMSYGSEHNQGGWDAALGYFWNYNVDNGSGWAMSGDGFGDRVLTSGAIDGWAWGGWPTAPGDAVAAANAPVPEPSAFIALSSLFGLTGAARLLRRK